MLSDRRARVLALLIEEYVSWALPVGSRTLTQRYRLGVSPATVRNELSFLEDEGYISQPHTSAGRVPTDRGYRAFVNDLIASGVLQESSASPALIQHLKNKALELDEKLELASSALSSFTDCLSVVYEPKADQSPIQQLTLVALSDIHIVAVVVTKNGKVLNKHIELSCECSAQELSELQERLNNILVGHTCNDFRESDLHILYERGIIRTSIEQQVLEAVLLCLHDEKTAPRSHRVGMSSLAKKPEFSDTASIVPLMQILENDTVLFQMLDHNQTHCTNTLQVSIGSENKQDALSGVSVVTGRYGSGDNAGVIAVIGPTRLDYSKVIKAVQSAIQALNDAQ